VQFYVSKPGSSVERAEKELKAFKKINTVKGEAKTVSVSIPVQELAYFDTNSMKWVVEPGEYILRAGGSSRDIKQTVKFVVK
jgi:beta-glucosidase